MRGNDLVRNFILCCLILVPAMAEAGDDAEKCKLRNIEGVECSDVKTATCHKAYASCGQIKMLVKMCKTQFSGGERCSDVQYKFCSQHYRRCSDQKSAEIEKHDLAPKLRN